MRKLIFIIAFLGTVVACKKHHIEPSVPPTESLNSGNRITKVLIKSSISDIGSITYIPNYNSSGLIDSINIIDSTTTTNGVVKYITTLSYSNENLVQRIRTSSQELFTYDNNNKVLTYGVINTIGFHPPSYFYSFSYGQNGELSYVNENDAAKDSFTITDSSQNNRSVVDNSLIMNDILIYWNLKINSDNSFKFTNGAYSPQKISGQYSHLQNTIPSVLWDEITRAPNGLRYTVGYLDLIFRDIEPDYFILSSKNYDSSSQTTTNYSYVYTTDSYGRIQTIVENTNGMQSRTFTFYY